MSSRLTTPPKTTNRVFLIEDHALFREGLKKIVAEDFAVCGEASNAREAWERLTDPQPDLVLLDISLPGVDGLELTKSLKARYPDLCIMALSMHAEELYAERVLRAGAKGYVMKDTSAEELLKAMRIVLGGGVYVSPSLSKHLLHSLVTRKAQEKSGVEQLSDRELEIFRLLGDGFTTREIASALNISAKTVESHRGNIRSKLKLKTGAELLRAAIAHKSAS